MKRYFRRDNLTGQVAEITKGNYDTIRSLNVKTLTVWAEEQVEVVETKKRKRIQEAEVVDTTETVETVEATDTTDAIKSVETADTADTIEAVENTNNSETAEIVSFSEYTINKLKERPIVIKNEADRAIVEELKKKMRMW